MENLLQNLNKEQRQAVTHGEGPLLIVAGAGTGKTTVITNRIAWLINEGKAKPDEILALTFTDKAAGEMEERVDRLLPYGYVDLWVSTFHSFAERILKQHALDIGLPNDFKLLNQTEQWLLVRQNLDKLDLDYYKPLGNPTKFIHALLKHFSRAKDEAVEPAEYLDYVNEIKLNSDTAFNVHLSSGAQKSEIRNPKSETNSKFQIPNTKYETQDIKRLEEIANAYHVYEQLLLDNNALDFGDLINYTLKLFKKRPKILEQYRKKFKYILVDEFQDTNWAQYELIKLLAAPNNNLAVVGDDDQSIYKFRGASISNILQFKKDYPAAREVVLVNNFRSTQNILDLAYRFIKQNDPNRLEAELNIIKKLKSQKKEKGEIEHYNGRDLDDEVNWIINKILDLKNNPSAGSGSSKNKNLSWSDFSILVRANDSANIFIREMIKQRIPYQFMALRGLYNKPLVLDALAYFKLLDNYHESPAMWRVLNWPIWGIDDKDLIELSYEAKRKSESLYQVLKRIPGLKSVREETVKKANQLLSLMERHASLAKEKGVSELLVRVFKDSGYLEYLNRKDRTPEEEQKDRESLQYLQQFYKKITSFEADFPDPKLKDFMDLMELERESGEEGSLVFDVESGPDMVRIMTAHGAKGLEFEYVFIPNLVDRRFPTIERKEAIELPDELIKEIIPEGDIHLEEERRLFYVALTRAKRGVYFTSAENYGGARKKKLSRFLIELGFGEKKQKIIGVKQNGLPLKETEVVIKKQQYSLPKRFSFTQLAAFDNCPLQYKFTHILKIPILGKAQFSFGKTMHNTLEKFLNLVLERKSASQKDLFGNKGGSEPTGEAEPNFPSRQELLDIYKEEWIDFWYDSKEEKGKYRKKGEKSLTDFYEKFIKEQPKVKFLEQDFNVKIGEFTLRGRIDRIDEFEDGVEIVDYKTGNSKDELSSEDKIQLLIYQLAATEVLGLKPVKLTYYYLDDNKEVSFMGKEKDLEKLRVNIIKRIEKIKESDFAAIPNFHICRFCDYKDICEYRANGA